MATAKLHYGLDDDNIIVEEIDGNNYMEYGESAYYVAAQDFGMKNADEASEDDVQTFLRRNDGKTIEVDPDFFMECPQKSERPDLDWDTAPIDYSAK